MLPMLEAVKVCCDAADASMRSRLLQHCRPTRMSLARWALLSVSATCSEESRLAICEDATRAAPQHVLQTFTCTHVQSSSCYLLHSVCGADVCRVCCAVPCMAAERALLHPDGPGRAWQPGASPQTGLSPPIFLSRATEASATRCQPCSSTRSSRSDCSCCICMPSIRKPHVQVQEEGLLLPDALVWQVLWEVAQVRPNKDQESLHLFQPTQG